MASSPRQSTPNMDKLIQEALHRRAALERQHSIHTATSASPSNGRRNENENATPGQPDNHSAALYLPDGSLMEEVVRPQKEAALPMLSSIDIDATGELQHEYTLNIPKYSLTTFADSKAHEERGGMRRKKSRRQLGGVNAPPRHVHCNDWREMLALTSSTAKPMDSSHKSEGDLQIFDRDGQIPLSEEFNTNSVTGGTRRPSVGSLPGAAASQSPEPQLDPKLEAVCRLRYASGGSTAQDEWIEQTFSKRECCQFIASSRDSNKCGCGRLRSAHTVSALAAVNPLNTVHESARHHNIPSPSLQKWSIGRHTITAPTDAYGTLEFQGGPHPFKAQYLRLSFDSEPADIMALFEHVWQMAPPKLIITVHGGITNFDIQPKLARVFRKGLLKAARTTGAWIITSGMNAGVVRHVAAALEGAISTSKARAKIVSIGIAPWGLLKKREDFVGRDKVVSYHPHSFPPKGKFAVLNNRHSYFLLVDNGTVGRYGADIILRRRLESYIAEKQKIGGGARSVPVVCVVLEGGTCTVRTVLDYVTKIPRVPVVVCDGSGRASDLLAFAHQYIQEDGNLPEGVRPQLLSLIENVFSYDKANAQCLVLDILACVRQKHMITVFRLGENQKHDVDYAILTALLKGHNLSPAEQLSLALAWNRVDIARSDIFVMGQDWPKSALHNAMLEALIHNRVDFVRLLLENGVSMHDFLTIGRLEELYNTDQGPPNTLYYIVRDVVKIRTGYHYKLIHIGMAIEKLMANGFRSHYTSSDFRHKYSSYRTKCREASRRNKESAQQRSGSEFFSSSGGIHGPAAQSLLATLQPPSMANSQSHPLEKEHVLPAISGSRALSNHILWRSAYRRDNFITPSMLSGCNMPQGKELAIELEDDSFCGSGSEHGKDFKYPFSDLLVWAVLTKRHEMALCMWQHGEEAMAKALVACRLYKSLAKEAAEDYLEVEICDELKKYAEEFRQLSLELLDHCYKQDDAQTLQLLTYELFYWGHETCLSLAVIVNNKQFLAHPCCQILLADLWHGGLRIRSNSNFKVIMGILFPPSIFLLEFKSREELMLQPQTAAEHEEAINNDSSSSSSESSSSSDSETDELSSLDGHGNNAGVKGTTTAAGTDNLNRLHVDHLTATNQLDRRRTSTGSVQSLNLASLFQSKRRRHRNRATTQFPAMDNTRELPSGIEMRSKEPHEHHDMSRKRTRSRPSSSVLGGVGAIALSATSALGAVSSPIAASSGHTSPGLTTPTPKATAMHLEAPGSNGSPAGLHGSSKRRIPSLFQWRRQTRSFKQGDEEAPRFHVPSFVVGGEDETSSRDSSCKNSPRNVADNYPLTTSSLAQHTNRRHSSSAHKNKVNEGEVNKAAESTGFPKGIPLPNVLPFNRKRQIKFRRKVYEFFVAPITTFWAWSISFVIFLSTLTYVLLIRTPPVPTYLEWYLLAYVVTFGLESIRKFFMSEPKKFSEKMEYFFGNYWNFITSVAIIGFVIGFCFRVNPSTSSNYGRIILAVDSVLWSIKLLDFLSVHPRFGPYITMAGKMVMNMSSIIVMLLISLLAFGLARQSITFPDEDWHWLLLRNVFYKPYFMLYGEVYADEIDTCGDEAWDEHLDKGIKISQTGNETNTGSCVPGHWIPPLMMTVFLLIANILLISMLIAIFNNIYDSSSKISQQIWLFQRYRQVIEYEGTPFLPPPLTTIYHIYMLVKYLRYKNVCCFSKKFPLCGCCKKAISSPADSKHHSHGLKTIKYKEKKLALFDFTLKLFLSEDQVEKLHDFEEESMEDMAREKEYEKNRSSEERLHRTAERTDLILVRLNDLSSKENMLKGNVRELETRLEVMESRQSEILDCMRQINTTFSNLPMLLQCLQNASQSVPNQGVYQPHISETSHPTSFPQMSYITPEEEGESEDHVLVTSESLPEKQSEKTIPPTASGPAPPSRQISVAESMMAGRTRGSTLAFNDTTRLRAVSHATIMGSNTSSINAMSYTNTDGFGSALLEQPFAAAQRRHRTSTIAGGDIPTASVPMSVLNQSQRFESLASLEAKGPSAPQVIVHPLSRRGNSIRRRRRHDEYTSITDAINIEDILAAEAAAALEQSDESDHEDSQRSSRRRAGTSQPSIINKLEEGLQTEDDEADEDDEAEDEEDFDADDYEVEELRISGLGKLGDSIGIGIDMGDGEEDLEGELELKICTNSRINRLNEDEEDQQISSQNSTVHRVDTPNTTLRRARSSFIIHQNSVLKSFEEDVGGLSSSLYRDPQADNKQYASLDNSDMAFNNAYLKKTKSVEKQNSVTRESPKNEFINFSTPSTHYKMGGSLEGEDSRQSMKDTQEEHAHSAEQLKAKQNDF